MIKKQDNSVGSYINLKTNTMENSMKWTAQVWKEQGSEWEQQKVNLYWVVEDGRAIYAGFFVLLLQKQTYDCFGKKEGQNRICLKYIYAC